MISLPPIPVWQALHPLIVHFPIALLLTAPLFVLLGIARGSRGGPFLLAALILMGLGTLSAFVATSTGQVAADRAEQVPGIKAVLEEHEELAETTAIAFAALTTIFAAIVFVPRLLRLDSRPVTEVVLPLVFLLFYAAGSVLLVNTAHAGGRLVHQFGVTAAMAPADPGPLTRRLP